METVLIVIHLIIVLALVGVVLLQRSEGGGLGIGGGGGGGTGGFMSARGTANLLTRTTAILGTIFFITSLGLSIIANIESGSTLTPSNIPQGETAPAVPGTDGPSILDQISPPSPDDAPAPPQSQ